MEALEKQIVEFLREHGPSLPVKVSKEVGKSILMTSAILSGMVNEKKILKTHKKTGESSLYYLPEQEEEVKKAILNSLNDIEVSAFKKLKGKKVFSDNQLTPRQKVFVRKFRDFFKPIDRGGEELVWAYFTVSKDKLKEYLKGKPVEKVDDRKTQVLSHHSLNVQEDESEEEKKLPPLKLDFGKEEGKEEEEKEEEDEEGEEEEEKEEKEEGEKEEGGEEESEGEDDDEPDTFVGQVKQYFESKGIKIRDVKVERKNREVNLIAVIKSSLGKHVYFVKAANKKRFNERDLALAWTEARSRGMPCIFLITGRLTRGGKEFYKDKLKNFVLLKEL